MIMIPKHRAYVLILSAAAFCLISLWQAMVSLNYFGEEQQVVHGTGTATNSFRRRLSTINIYAYIYNLTWNQLVSNQNMTGTLGYGVIPESRRFYRKLDKKVREREIKYAEANATNKLLYTGRIWTDNNTDNNWNIDARRIWIDNTTDNTTDYNLTTQLLVPIDRRSRIQARDEIQEGIPT